MFDIFATLGAAAVVIVFVAILADMLLCLSDELQILTSLRSLLSSFALSEHR